MTLLSIDLEPKSILARHHCNATDTLKQQGKLKP